MATLLTGEGNMNIVNTGHTFCVSRKAGRLVSVDMSLCLLSLLSLVCVSQCSDPGISHGLSEAEEQEEKL